MAYGKSIGHAIVDVTLKNQGRDPNMFGPIMSKMAGDADSVTMKYL